MELAINRKTLKVEFNITGKNLHHDLIWVQPVLGFNDDLQTLKLDSRQESMDLKKFDKKYRIMQVY